MIKRLIQRFKSWRLHRQILSGKAVHGRVPAPLIKLSLFTRIKLAFKTLGKKYED